MAVMVGAENKLLPPDFSQSIERAVNRFPPFIASISLMGLQHFSHFCLKHSNEAKAMTAKMITSSRASSTTI